MFAGIIGSFAGGAVGAQTVFRRAYFHQSLPNTYFLKLYKISALDRIKRGAFVALEVLTLHLAVPLSIVAASLGLERPSLAWAKRIWADRTAGASCCSARSSSRRSHTRPTSAAMRGSG